MRVLITGICGFAGHAVAMALAKAMPECQLIGIDNFIRPGSQQNRESLKSIGAVLLHGDIRSSSDMEILPEADWVIDAAANPSVLAGIDGNTSSRQLVEHNLVGTINLLEYCKKVGAGFILLSTSRVYSIPGVAGLKLAVRDRAFQPLEDQDFPEGIGLKGISESYSTQAPVSLYGASKVASEALVMEYGSAFNLPVWINRCGVLAGAGQFGRPDQGIFSYWIHAWKQRRPLQYIGFDGCGHQVRDCLHPEDLARLLIKQLNHEDHISRPSIINVSGGIQSAMSLRQLSGWCNDRFGEHTVSAQANQRPYDIGWMVLDSTVAQEAWNWKPTRSTENILEEIAIHAEQNPGWLDLSAPY